MLIELNARTVIQFGVFGIRGGRGDSFAFQVFTAYREGALGPDRSDLEFVPRGQSPYLFSNCEDMTVVSTIAH